MKHLKTTKGDGGYAWVG